MLAALELGVSDFDASVGGLGGCPYAPGATGNIATEELVHMAEDMGVATGIDLEAMIAAAAEAESIVGRRPALPGRAPGRAQDNCPMTDSGEPRETDLMTDFPKLRESIERGGAVRYHETAAARRASCSPGTGSRSWSTKAASTRTAGSPTRWPTGCPRTALSPGRPPSAVGRWR